MFDKKTINVCLNNLINEKNEIDFRINEMNSILEKDDNSLYPFDEQLELLTKQRDLLVGYSDLLNKRIDNYLDKHVIA